MRSECDVLLAGATGQIGYWLDKALKGRYYVKPYSRHMERIPTAKIVINAAGYTKFDDDIGQYWESNILLATRLAEAAVNMGAHFVQLSSEAVAEFRSGVIPEVFGTAVPHSRMNNYAISKVLVESVVESIVPRDNLTIYRVSDVISTDPWRRNHWLSLLFEAGYQAFAPHDDYPVWIATVENVTEAIYRTLGRPGVFHLLGHQYTFGALSSAIPSVESPIPVRYQRLVSRILEVIRINPPLSSLIAMDYSARALSLEGFSGWVRVELRDWRRYANIARSYQISNQQEDPKW